MISIWLSHEKLWYHIWYQELMISYMISYSARFQMHDIKVYEGIYFFQLRYILVCTGTYKYVLSYDFFVSWTWVRQAHLRLKAADLLLTKAHTSSSINNFIMILQTCTRSLCCCLLGRGLGCSIGSLDRHWLPSRQALPHWQQRDPRRRGHYPLPGTDVVAPTKYSE